MSTLTDILYTMSQVLELSHELSTLIDSFHRDRTDVDNVSYEYSILY